MNSLAEKFGHIADFLVVYISEAHPKDVWPLGKHVEIDQHKTIEDRINAAKFYKKQFGLKLPIVVDGMDNEFDNIYASWPERFFIFHKDKIALIAEPSLEDKGFDKKIVYNYLTDFEFFES